MQGLPANIFKSGVLRTANSITRPSPSLFSFLGLTSRPWHQTTDLDWAEELQKSTHEIRSEYFDHAAATNSDYEIKADEHSLHSGEWEWRSYIKKGVRDTAFAERCPTTASVLDKCPDLQTDIPFAYTFFSTMKPGTEIETHTAPCNIRLRGHLPLIVPDGDCGITVGGVTKTYEEGQLLLFDDSYPHETWHRGEDKDRVILLFDVWHPDLTYEERASIVTMFEIAQQQ
jgi:aspartyl/asparaginyl beta-hydroxylase (cupin superfamily)